MLADAAWRERARPATLAAWSHRWAKIDVEETVAHGAVAGVPLDRLAADRGSTPFDVMLDLGLADDMRTRFRVVLENDADDEIGALLADKRTLLGLSDAGAHASQLCDACYSTHLLGHWVRERKALSLVDAVWRLTGHPARAFRIAERGRGRAVAARLRRPGLPARFEVCLRPMPAACRLTAGMRSSARSPGTERRWC